jgi:hypothetical protein
VKGIFVLWMIWSSKILATNLFLWDTILDISGIGQIHSSCLLGLYM